MDHNGLIIKSIRNRVIKSVILNMVVVWDFIDDPCNERFKTVCGKWAEARLIQGDEYTLAAAITVLELTLG